MQRLVMKFGGTSVADGERIKNVAKIVERFRAKETVVVVSALANVTDSLLNFAKKVKTHVEEEEIKSFVDELKERHRYACEIAVNEEFRSPILLEIEKLCNDLEKVLTGISYIGELTKRSLDYVLSFGERLSAPILSGALKSIGIDSIWLSGGEAGIVTDSNFGRANVIWEKTEKLVREKLLPLLKDKVPVVTGFIAVDERGRITTLGRGGSDYTASIIGACIDADEIWMFKETEGIMTCDPRIVKNAKPIEVLSYIEAMELAYFGAKVLHPKTIEPAIAKNIPVRVKNTFNPNSKGTLIVSETKKTNGVVKAISVMKNVSLINISGAGMISEVGVASRVFNALASANVNVLMISQGSSEANISIVVSREDADKAVDSLKKEFKDEKIVKTIECNNNVAIIAVVGAGMRGTKGVAARVFRAVADAGVNVLMIAQGSSEVNISFVVLEEDADKAVIALHDEFLS